MPIRSVQDKSWWTSSTGRTRPRSQPVHGSEAHASIDGLEVLVRQGAASLRIWTGLEPPLETMRRAARES